MIHRFLLVIRPSIKLHLPILGALLFFLDFVQDTRVIAHLEKKLFGIPDFFIAFGSLIDANIIDIFGFGRGPPRWAWQPLKVL
jgi:hypothetical protein